MMCLLYDSLKEASKKPTLQIVFDPLKLKLIFQTKPTNMKNFKNYFCMIVFTLIAGTFTYVQSVFADGAPLPPMITISNAKLNGIPTQLGCKATVVFPVNSVLEFDINMQTIGDLPTGLYYSFLPSPPATLPTFTPPLPAGTTNDIPLIVHARWETPTAYTGTLIFTAQDFIQPPTTCQIIFDWVLPVELTSFVSIVNDNNVTLKWTTSNEINNSHFNIERGAINGSITNTWNTVGTVPGNGNSSEPISYIFNDNNLLPGRYIYRLNQIDYNGNFEYHYLNGEVEIRPPDKFSLSQNYPNPFNPLTQLEFTIPEPEFVSLKILDIQGKEVITLINEYKPAGRYKINFSGSNIGSGIYFYKLISGSYSAIKKMMLIK